MVVGCCLYEIVNYLRIACILQAKVVYYICKEAMSYGKNFKRIRSCGA